MQNQLTKEQFKAMTQNKEVSIADMNSTIAEFMGYERYEDTAGIWFKKEGLIKCLHPKLQELCFHSDWNQFHSAWQKFRDLKIDSSRDQRSHSIHKDSISRQMTYGTIEAAHLILWDGITWYNSTLKK